MADRDNKDSYSKDGFGKDSYGSKDNYGSYGGGGGYGGRRDDSYGDDMGGYDRDERSSRKSGGFKKRACKFCNEPESLVDYKNVRLLQSFVTEHGKIVPRRITGNCAYIQRKMTGEIKKARILGLMGFVSPGPNSNY